MTYNFILCQILGSLGYKGFSSTSCFISCTLNHYNKNTKWVKRLEQILSCKPLLKRNAETFERVIPLIECIPYKIMKAYHIPCILIVQVKHYEGNSSNGIIENQRSWKIGESFCVQKCCDVGDSIIVKYYVKLHMISSNSFLTCYKTMENKKMPFDE